MQVPLKAESWNYVHGYLHQKTGPASKGCFWCHKPETEWAPMEECVPRRQATTAILAEAKAVEHPVPARLRELADRFGSCYSDAAAQSWVDSLADLLEEVRDNLRSGRLQRDMRDED